MDTRYATFWVRILAGIVLLAGLACNMPGSVANETGTDDSLAALLTGTAAGDSPSPTEDIDIAGGGLLPTETLAPGEASSTATPAAANAPPPTNTPDQTGCHNDSEFVADVNFPDDTTVATGETFTKTWRLANTGSCIWGAGYQFAFLEGQQMAAPDAVELGAVVGPGSEHDISVTFTAPTTPGTYVSTWQMRTPDGQSFGTRPYVRIRVRVATATSAATQAATPEATASATEIATEAGTAAASATATATPSGPVTVTVEYTESLSAQVSSAGEVFAAPNVGDTESNTGVQAFVTFDLSAIPAEATITNVKLDLKPFDNLGTPFGALGCLRVYPYAYGTATPDSYFTAEAFGANWRFCSLADLTSEAIMTAELFDSIQGAIGSNYQLRLQFNEMETNGNSTADMLRPTPSLVITYELP